MKNTAISLGMSCFLAASVSLFAHHGTGISYDMHKVVVLKGVVKEFVIQNPHSQLYFDVTDEKGNVAHWAAEMRNPRNFESYGYTKKFLLGKFAPGAHDYCDGQSLQSRVARFGFRQGSDGRWLVPVQPPGRYWQRLAGSRWRNQRRVSCWLNEFWFPRQRSHAPIYSIRRGVAG